MFYDKEVNDVSFFFWGGGKGIQTWFASKWCYILMVKNGLFKDLVFQTKATHHSPSRVVNHGIPYYTSCKIHVFMQVKRTHFENFCFNIKIGKHFFFKGTCKLNTRWISLFFIVPIILHLVFMTALNMFPDSVKCSVD